MPAIIPIPAPPDNYIHILRIGEPARFAAAEVPAACNLARAVDALAALRDWKNKL